MHEHELYCSKACRFVDFKLSNDFKKAVDQSPQNDSMYSIYDKSYHNSILSYSSNNSSIKSIIRQKSYICLRPNATEIHSFSAAGEKKN